MDVFKLFQWDNSLKAIQNLEKLLQCSICNQIAEDAKNLGRCEHFYCANCVDKIENGKCPKCKIPAPPCEMQPDRIVSNLVASARDLRLLLDGGEITTGCQQGFEAPPSAFTPHTPKRASEPLKSTSINSKKMKSAQTKLTPKGENKTVFKADKSNPMKAPSKSKTATSSKPVSKTSNKLDNSLANSSNVKQKDCIVPLTPEGKKLLKVTDLSALGMSPSAPSINKRNAKGETMLHIACIKGDTEKVKNLLEEGANPNSKDNAGWTPLHEACSHGFCGIAEMLLQHGAIIDVPGGDKDDSPLHDAVTGGELEVIKLLRSWGASEVARNRAGHTPRALASMCMGAEELNAALDTKENLEIKRPPVMAPFLDKMILLGAGLTASQSKKLDQFSKMLKVRLVSDISPEVSHIIANCTSSRTACLRTPEYLMGVASGKWVVSYEWIEKCLSEGLPVSPDTFQVSGSYEGSPTDAPIRARTNASKMRPGLFRGLHIYLSGAFREPFRNKKSLEAVIKGGNGVVLAREPNPETSENMQSVPYHADPDSVLGKCSHVILYQEGNSEPQIKYNMNHFKTLPISWLIKCIENFSIVPPVK